MSKLLKKRCCCGGEGCPCVDSKYLVSWLNFRVRYNGVEYGGDVVNACHFFTSFSPQFPCMWQPKYGPGFGGGLIAQREDPPFKVHGGIGATRIFLNLTEWHLRLHIRLFDRETGPQFRVFWQAPRQDGSGAYNACFSGLCPPTVGWQQTFIAPPPGDAEWITPPTLAVQRWASCQTCEEIIGGMS